MFAFQDRGAFLVTFQKKCFLHFIRTHIRFSHLLTRKSDGVTAEIGGIQPHRSCTIGGSARIAAFLDAIVSALQFQTAALFTVSAGRFVSALDVDGVTTLRNRLPHVDFTVTLRIFVTQVTRKDQ
jgi:hypothetical protein